MTTPTAIRKLARQAAEKRRLSAEFAETVRVRMKQWEEENHEALEAKRLSAEELAKAEAALREAAIELYRDTGEKRPAPGVEVKLVKSFSYDAEEARSWAVKHGISTVLKLDARAYEKVAETMTPDLVTVEQEPKAYIALDLEKHYGEGA